MSRTVAILAAAGFGTRMGSIRPKQYQDLAGVPILIRTVRVFADHRQIDRIVIVAAAEHLQECRQLLGLYHLARPEIVVVAGGRRRQDSVRAGLAALDSLDDLDIESDLVLVHDAARPLLSPALIDRCLAAAARHGAAIAAIPVKDTLKRDDGNGRVAGTVDRNALWQAQTPQVARRHLLIEAFRCNGEREVTDEAGLLEGAGIPVQLVAGEESNLKITRLEDIPLAESILGRQRTQPQPRIGHGYDAHRFAPDRPLILGGVKIPHPLGLAGHSDADVLTHALCDALLGALAAGDIGRHFPDSDSRFAGISSLLLLAEVVGKVASAGYRLGNADITVVCQAPRLAPHIDAMRAQLASVCGVAGEQVNIKATTTENMGFTGRGEGISCHAVTLLQAD